MKKNTKLSDRQIRMLISNEIISYNKTVDTEIDLGIKEHDEKFLKSEMYQEITAFCEKHNIKEDHKSSLIRWIKPNYTHEFKTLQGGYQVIEKVYSEILKYSDDNGIEISPAVITQVFLNTLPDLLNNKDLVYSCW